MLYKTSMMCVGVKNFRSGSVVIVDKFTPWRLESLVMILDVNWREAR